ncbi:MAG: twin-arginine translocase TatA/TatE family subunit [Chloroflexi bacterium]|nr:twin-arginine translocase TatA/TatE family subunit [Chloroflexota bacterium]
MPGPLLIGPLGPLELAIIVGVIVLLFGVGRISRIGGDLGSSIKEFRRAVREDDEEEEGATEETQVQAQVQPEQPAPQQPVQQAAPPAQQAAPPAAAPPADSAPQGDGTTRNVF